MTCINWFSELNMIGHRDGVFLAPKLRGQYMYISQSSCNKHFINSNRNPLKSDIKNIDNKWPKFLICVPSADQYVTLWHRAGAGDKWETGLETGLLLITKRLLCHWLLPFHHTFSQPQHRQQVHDRVIGGCDPGQGQWTHEAAEPRLDGLQPLPGLPTV